MGEDRAAEMSERTSGPGRGGSRLVSLRAIVLGIVLIPLSIHWQHQLEIVWFISQPTTISLFYHVVFIFLVLMAANALVRRLRPSLALTQNEILIVYIMLVLANSIAGHDQLEVLVCMVGGGTWFATNENQWQEMFGNALPNWLVVRDMDVLRGFFLGDSALSTRNLAGWVTPLGAWGIFIVVLFVMTLAINVILRKQWSNRERLTYPIAQVPIEMSRPGFFALNNRLFWLGFGAAFAVDMLNAFASLYPSLPSLDTHSHWHVITALPLAHMGFFTTSFYPFVIGLGYFLPVDLLFSLWFFHWFWKAQTLAAGMLGFGQSSGFPYVFEQSTGGFVGIFLFALYLARHHLKAVFRRAVFGGNAGDEAGELMPYRIACAIVVLGFILLLAFAVAVGAPLWVGAVFFTAYMVISLAVTRMRAEVGPPAHEFFLGGPTHLLPRIFGSTGFSTSTLSFFTLTWWMNRAFSSQPMPNQVESIRIGERQKIDSRLLLAAMILACIVGILASYWSMLSIGYTNGIASAKMNYLTLSFSRTPYEQLAQWISLPSDANRGVGIAVLVGTAFTVGLLLLRSAFNWFPLHPVGYALSSSWSAYAFWMPLLIAWIAKAAILRYGGLRLYRRVIPLFLGLILGEFCTGAIWSIVGVIIERPVWIFWS